MKNSISKLMLSAATAALITIPAIASAAPPQGSVKAEGITSLHAPDGTVIYCKTTLMGTINGGQVSINSASFDGTPTNEPRCAFVQGGNLPSPGWTGSFGAAPSYSPLNINNVEVDVPLLGVMCTGTVSVPYDDSSKKVNFGPDSDPTPLGACEIDGTLTISTIP